MDVDFEPSKENILPLAKGRVSSALRDGLHPEDAEFHQKRRYETNVASNLCGTSKLGGAFGAQPTLLDMLKSCFWCLPYPSGLWDCFARPYFTSLCISKRFTLL